MRLNRGLIGAIAMGVVATTLAWVGGPRPAQLGTETTGDHALASSVRAGISDPKGYRDLAVALVEDGEVRFAGLASGEVPEIGPDTAFEVGSVVKALTGMLLADLARDGTVGENEPLRALLPEVAFDNPALAETTAAELASHRSGLPPVRITGLGQALGINLRVLRGKDPYAGQDSAWLMSTIAGARVGSGERKVDYSNYGFAVLGHALAERAGVPYPELLTARILDPLGMHATGFYLDGAPLPEHRVSGRTASGRPMDPWQASGYAPAGIGAWSTAADLARLLSAMLAGTAPGADAAVPRFEETADRRIGYGWFIESVDGQEITWHNGGTGGFRSFVGFDRAADRGVVVLGNTDRWVDDIGRRLLATGADDGAAGGGTDGDGGGGPGLLPIAMTIILSLVGGLGLLFATTRARVDRLRLVSNAIPAIALPVVAYPLGAWLAVPTWVWAAGVGLSVVAATLAVRRWRDVPCQTGRFGRLRWAGTATFALAAAGLVTWLHI